MGTRWRRTGAATVIGALALLNAGPAGAAATPAPHAVSVSCWNRASAVPYTRITPGAWATPIAAPLRALVARPGRYAGLRLDLMPTARWAVVSHDATHRIFAQRTAKGIAAVVYFKRYLGTWRVDVQCSIDYADGHADRVESVAVRGRTLDLNWSNGTCFPQQGGPISALVRRVVVTQSPTLVTVSLITYENPAEIAAFAAIQATLPPHTVVVCAGVGLGDHTKVTLTAPLGKRALLDVSTVPPVPLDRNGTVGKPLR